MAVSEFGQRTVMVVGAGTGLGAAIVDAFRQADATVVVDAGAARADCITVALDYGVASGLTEAFDAAEAAAGPLDILVLAAKPVATAKFLDVPADELRKVIEQELVWFALLMQEAARRMAARGRGRIITLCSMSGKTGVHQHVGPYAAAKGGLITLSRVLAAELGQTGVTVNAIATALFEPQVAHHPEARRAEIARGIPVGRFGRPSEAAHAVLFLASEQAGYITGETLNLSGGRFMD